MHTTEGIILKKIPYGEAGALITVLTKDFGKITLAVQGVKKEAAKLKGHIEPMTHSAVSFVIGKNMYRATSADSIDFFPNIRSDFDKLSVVSYVINLIDANTFEERGDPRLFESVRDAFVLLDGAGGGRSEYEKILHDFHIRFLDIFGLLPPQKIGADHVRTVLANQLGVRYDIMGL